MLRIGDRIAITYHRRSVLIWCAVTVLLLSLSIATLMFGTLGISPTDLVDVVRGQASATTEFALQRERGPRLFIAILAGDYFGISCTLFLIVIHHTLSIQDFLCRV